jgi:clostripain
VGVGPREAGEATWTVMIYGGVDSTAESYLMPHLADLKNASDWGVRGDVALMIDRVKGATRDRQALGDDFADTRLYHLGKGRWDRVDGGAAFPEITTTSEHEANTGEARTLGKFVRFAKQTYPADRYALILFGHGESRSVCPDVSSPCADSGEFEDALFTAEISEGLTAEESVDLLWVDVCSFGSAENAYQFRPRVDRFSARAMLTSPSLSFPAPILEVLQACGIVKEAHGRESAVRNGAMFATAAVETIGPILERREAMKTRVEREAWAGYDLDRVAAVKQAVDALAVELADGDSRLAVGDVRGWGEDRRTLDYMYFRDPQRWVSSPYFDLFDFARRLGADPRFSESVRAQAREVARAADAVVLASVGTDRGDRFLPGQHGLYIVFPGGVPAVGDAPVWSFFRWYHPGDQRALRTAYGHYDWCHDGALPGNDRVENWFELLDSWLDVNDASGGFNGYRW